MLSGMVEGKVWQSYFSGVSGTFFRAEVKKYAAIEKE